MKLYARISQDKFQFIEYITDSVAEMAEHYHTTVNSVLSSISHHVPTYEKIEVEDDEEIINDKHRKKIKRALRRIKQKA